MNFLDQASTTNYSTRAAAASGCAADRAIELFGELGDREDQAYALNELGVVQRLTGDHSAAAASLQQALAEALNSLGDLLSRSSDSQRARDHHTQALAIARDLGAPLEEAHALEGIGRCHIRDGNPGEGVAHLAQALAIYQRIGAPDAQRVQQTLHNHKLASPAPSPHQRHPKQRSPSAPMGPPRPHKAARQPAVRTHAPSRQCDRTALICARTARQAPSRFERADRRLGARSP